MKLKYILLVLIIIVMIPEILLISYIFSKYTLNIELPQLPVNDFLSFLFLNPFFLIIILVVFICMLILYFALQAK
jgi:hypothetical protein